MKSKLRLLVLGLGICALGFSNPEDPKNGDQYRGPNRDGVYENDKKIKLWQSDAPREVWKTPIGDGFSAIVFSGKLMYTMFAGDGEDSTEYIAAFDPKSAREKWRYAVGKMFSDPFGNGPRATPTIDGNMIYALGSMGELHALNKKNGKLAWKASFVEKFESRVPRRGFTTSPLIDGDNVLVIVGGGEGEALASFNKKTGELAWTAHDGRPSHSSPIQAEIDGVKHNFFTSVRVVDKKPVHEALSVSSDGKVLWSTPSLPAVIAMPLHIPPDKFFVSGSMDEGCAVYQVVQEGGDMKVKEVWANRSMKNHFNSSLYYDGHIYGFSKSTFKCIDAETGEQKWAKRGFGKGNVIIGGGYMIVVSDKGKLAVLEINPEEYVEVKSAQVLNGKSWTTPTYVNGKIYLRNRTEMACFDLEENAPAQ